MMRGLRRWRSSQKRSEWDGAHSRRFSCWGWESQIADHEKFQDESNDKTVQVNLVERKRISKSMKCIHPVVDQQKKNTTSATTTTSMSWLPTCPSSSGCFKFFSSQRRQLIERVLTFPVWLMRSEQTPLRKSGSITSCSKKCMTAKRRHLVAGRLAVSADAQAKNMDDHKMCKHSNMSVVKKLCPPRPSWTRRGLRMTKKLQKEEKTITTAENGVSCRRITDLVESISTRISH